MKSVWMAMLSGFFLHAAFTTKANPDNSLAWPASAICLALTFHFREKEETDVRSVA